MASRAIFDILKLLRLSPFLISTATFTYANCESLFYSVFLTPTNRSKASASLSTWFGEVFNRTILPLVLAYSANIIVAAANLVVCPEQLDRAGYARLLYGVGMLGSMGHFVFVPTIMRSVEKIVYNKGEGGPVKAMETLLSSHRIRTMITDFPAWLAYGAAVFMVVDLKSND
jgi:hypothetical protein